MLSKTAQYALRALTHIAHQNADQPVLARDIAAQTGVPLQYLSQILREAVRTGLLESTRGIGGGFRLARAASKIRLIEILGPFDDVLGCSQCPFGQPHCSDHHPCGFHEFWKPVAAAYRQLLENTTLAEVGSEGMARAARPGRARVARPR
ncbi:MAG: putative HTH-type transcriptional regulator [Phycisphaerae bacterium]|nr:putative HTH-type transcriptional regulator [Phycisphaerae bacterium]